MKALLVLLILLTGCAIPTSADHAKLPVGARVIYDQTSEEGIITAIVGHLYTVHFLTSGFTFNIAPENTILVLLPGPAPTPTPAPNQPLVIAATCSSDTVPGIVADGVTDNSAAMLAAIRTRCPLHWPSGIIAFGSPIVIGGPAAPGFESEDVIWEGNGPFSTILKYTGSGTAVTVGSHAPFYGPGLRLKDLSLFGRGNQTCLHLRSLTVPGPVLDNVRFKFCDVALFTENVYNLELEHSTFQTNNIGVKLGHTTTATTLRMTEFAGNQVGIWLEGSGIQGIRMLENSFEVNGVAIKTDGGEFVHVRENYFTANAENFVHSGAGFLNGAFIEQNFGISAKFGDNVRMVVIRDNAVDDTASYSIKNEYTTNSGAPRRIYASRNWSAFGPTPYAPYAKYDGAQAGEIVQE